MEETIKNIEMAAEQIRALNPDSPYRGSALSALSAAKDNLKWHGEWDIAEAARKAKAMEGTRAEPSTPAAPSA